ncbi:MAG TPA: DUF4931 domain-containing protein [Dehalococcoidia bacterium]|nr:DUF4931 domain-containing protein [Dehalococcoidia bacterium]
MPDETAAAPPELRRNSLTGEYVIVAPARGRRPHSQPLEREKHPVPRYDPDCPLCPGNESETPPPLLVLQGDEDGGEWSVRVVPNRYPVVAPGHGGPGSTDGVATGAHEVLVETPRHDLDLPDRGVDSVAQMLEALHQRLQALEQRRGTQHVIAFKNRGREAGTSLDHPHSQIMALDFLPPVVRRRVALARRFYRRSGRCALCALIEDERRNGARLVFEMDGFIALTSFAGDSPGEALLVPLRHAASFSESYDMLPQHSRALHELMTRNRDALDDPPYNLVLHGAPVRALDDPALHWFWQLSPRGTIAAGFELGTGVLVNPLPPEEAAAMLRRAD